jgi:uncharacterized protein (DUF924 family)
MRLNRPGSAPRAFGKSIGSCCGGAIIDSETILTYWFGTDPDGAALAKDRADLWWSKNTEIDREIRERFETSVRLAGKGMLSSWRAEPRGRLALIILTDQFPRNIYRDSPRAFAFDAGALELSLDGIARDADRLLRPIERVFFYLPLEHSERLEDQERSVRKFTELIQMAGVEQREIFESYLNFAILHRDIVARFGRFPHRNTILGRPSTPEELYFLSQPGSSF